MNKLTVITAILGLTLLSGCASVNYHKSSQPKNIPNGATSFANWNADIRSEFGNTSYQRVTLDNGNMSIVCTPLKGYNVFVDVDNATGTTHHLGLSVDGLKLHMLADENVQQGAVNLIDAKNSKTYNDYSHLFTAMSRGDELTIRSAEAEVIKLAGFEDAMTHAEKVCGIYKIK